MAGRMRMAGAAVAAVLLMAVLAGCVPLFPSGASLSAVPEGAFVRLSWPAASHDADKAIASYRVDVDGVEVSRVSGTATTCLLKGLANSSTHQVTITAYDTADKWSGSGSGASAAVIGTVIAPSSGDPGTEVVCEGPTGTPIVTAPLPEGNARFVDSLVRDLIGREPTPSELSTWMTQLDSSSQSRVQLAQQLALSDEMLGTLVDHLVWQLLDRAPSPEERAFVVAGTRSASGWTTNWVPSVVGGAEFFAKAGGTNEGFVVTAGQRILKRDLSSSEIAPRVADLDAGVITRTEVARDLYTGAESAQVRGKTWAQKLLSRNPTDTELESFGAWVLNTGDANAIAVIASTPDYFDLAQTRFSQATLTPTTSTVIVSGSQVASATYAADGTGNGTVVLAAGVAAPVVGGFLVVNDPTDPSLGGIGRVTSVTAGSGGTTVIAVTGAELADAFPTGEIMDTTEVTDPEVVSPGADAGESAGACSAEVDQVLTSTIGVDVSNGSQISWGWRDFDAKIQLNVTPKAAIIAKGSLSASCEKQLWQVQWQVPLQAGPVTIPGYISTDASVGVDANLSALELSAALELPCHLGVRATKNTRTNLNGCDWLRSDVTFNPTVTGHAKAYAKASIGYHLGVDKGFAKANIGLDLSAELAVEANVSTATTPAWTVDAYLDASADLTGAFGPWDLNYNIATGRLYSKRLAEGALGSSTTRPGTYEPTGTSTIRTGFVSGRVVRVSDGSPVAGVGVTVWQDGGIAVTDAGGRYTVSGIPAGSHQVSFYPPAGVNLVPEFYGDTLLSTSAPFVMVQAGKETVGVNGSLAEGASISGTLEPDIPGTPAPGVCIGATDFAVSSFSRSPDDGGYCSRGWGPFVISGLPAGNYHLILYGGNIVLEYWKDSLSYDGATLIHVDEHGAVTGINAKVEVVAG